MWPSALPRKATELTESYRLTVERLRASRLPPAMVLMHLKFGFRDGECCGDCASLGEIWLHSQPVGQPYCHVARSFVAWDKGWLACGKWRAR